MLTIAKWTKKTGTLFNFHPSTGETDVFCSYGAVVRKPGAYLPPVLRKKQEAAEATTKPATAAAAQPAAPAQASTEPAPTAKASEAQVNSVRIANRGYKC